MFSAEADLLDPLPQTLVLDYISSSERQVGVAVSMTAISSSPPASPRRRVKVVHRIRRRGSAGQRPARRGRSVGRSHARFAQRVTPIVSLAPGEEADESNIIADAGRRLSHFTLLKQTNLGPVVPPAANGEATTRRPERCSRRRRRISRQSQARRRSGR